MQKDVFTFYTVSNLDLKPRSVGRGRHSFLEIVSAAEEGVLGNWEVAGAFETHQSEDRNCNGKRDVSEGGPHCHAGTDWKTRVPLRVLVHFLFCAEDLLKGIPLADKTLKTAQYLGPGNCLCIVGFVFFLNAFRFSLGTLLVVCFHYSFLLEMLL